MRFKRACLVLLGLCLAAALLESGLRAAGWLLERRDAAAAARAGSGESCRILALGESTTAPAFRSGRDISWPAQLSEILRTRYPGRSFQVVNRGRSATSTAAIVANAPDYFEADRPSIVVAMMGVNDDKWYGIVRFDSGWAGALERGLSRLKLWKLARYAADGIAARRRERALRLSAAARPGGADRRECLELSDGSAENAGDSLAACRRTQAASPGDPGPYEALAAYEQGLARWKEALAMAREAERRGSRNARTYLLLGDDLLGAGRYEEARSKYRACIALAADEPGMRDWCATRGLAMAYAAEKRYGEASNAFLLGVSSYPGWRWKPVSIAAAGVSAEKRPVTAANYRQLLRLARERGVVLAAMQYPGEPLGDLQEMLPDSRGVVWVDNKPSFDRALSARSYGELFSDRFAGSWGHCTAEGNRIIAENAARALAPLLDGGTCPSRANPLY